jgi:hypothetical protein
MPTDTYQLRRVYPSGSRVVLNHNNQWNNSPRVNGKLLLQSNAHYYLHTVEEKFELGGNFAFPVNLTANNPLFTDAMANFLFVVIKNTALAKFTGRVRKHNANLGVTLASFGQTRDMITSRSQKIANLMGDAVKFATKLSARERRRRAVKGTASDILEGMFGWVPLIQDIQAGFNALAREPPPAWVSASHTGEYRQSIVQQGSAYAYNSIVNYESTLRCTIGASAKVSNPNLWLANRLGLINLPGVAWDLVPWSFVVNLFTNCGQMVNSITDFVGVDFGNSSTTYSAKSTREIVNYPGTFPTRGYSYTSSWEHYKERSVGGIPSPSFMFRAPQLDFGLAAIAWGLVGQRIDKVNKLFGFK